MIKIDDLREAIAECEGVRNPNANTCIKLASFYTILNQMQGKEETAVSVPTYSFAAEPVPERSRISYESETEFGQIVNGQDPDFVLEVIDELMSTLQGMIPRLYEGVLIKLDK